MVGRPPAPGRVSCDVETLDSRAPGTTHELAAVRRHKRGGYRSRCSCRWTSGRYLNPEMARRAWAEHATIRRVGVLEWALLVLAGGAVLVLVLTHRR